MHYLNDFLFRFIYWIVGTIFFVSLLYLNRDIFICVSILPSYLTKYPITHLIFIEPKEVFLFYFYTGFFIYLTFLPPYAFFALSDFLKPALYSQEWVKFVFWQKNLILLFFFINLIAYFIIFPFFWEFFVSFNLSSLSSISFYLEISVVNYFKFFISIIILSNLIFLFLIIVFIIIYKFSFTKLVFLKPFFIALLIIISTILTPPAVEDQLMLFLFLYVILEMILFLFFISVFYKKHLLSGIILDRKPIKYD